MKRFFLILIILFPVFVFGQGRYDWNIKVNGDDIYVRISKWDPIHKIGDSKYWITIVNRTKKKKEEQYAQIFKTKPKEDCYTLMFSESDWMILQKDLDIIQKKFLEWITIARNNHVTSFIKSFPVENLSLQSPLFYNSLFKQYTSMYVEMKDSKAVLEGWDLSFNEKSIPHFKSKVNEFLRLAKQKDKELELFK